MIQTTNTSTRVGASRLKKRRDFLRIQKGGFRFKGSFLTIMSKPNFSRERIGRFGIVAPKTIGKAHDRNFIKRRLRHIVTEIPEILSKHDIVLLASSHALNASFDDLKSDVLKAHDQIRAPKAPSNRR